jgi:hypothetical protein
MRVLMRSFYIDIVLGAELFYSYDGQLPLLNEEREGVRREIRQGKTLTPTLSLLGRGGIFLRGER